MICAYCDHKATKVIDKRDSIDSAVTRRRRECLSCGRRFTTYERVESVNLLVIKRDGRREHFDREKLKKGITKALQKRVNDTPTIDNIVANIELDLLNIKSEEIQSTKIGEIVLEKLKGIDKLGYIRFASVYKEFKDIDDLRKEVLSLS